MDLTLIEKVMAKVRREKAMLSDWYGDEYTPVQVRYDELTSLTRHLLNHAHDIETNKCVKNRLGIFCMEIEEVEESH